MQLGMIGLGRMGHGMTARLREGGHEVQTYDPQVDERTAASLEELKSQLEAPRAFWMMVPAGKVTEDVFQQLLTLADAGDTIVDGGNSNFRDSKRRYVEAGNFEDIAPYVEDSGEGRWTINEAINENVPAPVIAASLFARFASRDEIKFSAKVAAALRQQFGGHAIRALEAAKAGEDPR
jgi:6-phosphogluconate dehydrogenase (decarboxylating)